MSRVESEDQRQKQHLRSALAAREAGDIRLALQEVYAALSIDPDYLAARLLCESLTDKQRPLSLGHEFPDEAMLSQPQGADIGAGRPGLSSGMGSSGLP
jgi:Tfp pilus assembly protein PilF